jgi:hypothetical protein
MPSRQVRPVSAAQVLAQQNAQIRKLQSFPPNGMTLLSSVQTATNDTYNYKAYPWASLPEATTGPFTLIRPVPILLVANMSFFDTGGNATFILVYANISKTNAVGQNADANDVNGNPMAALEYMHTCGFVSPSLSGSASLTGNYSAVVSFTAPAGTYYAPKTITCRAGPEPRLPITRRRPWFISSRAN